MSGLAEAVVVQDAQVVDVYSVRRGGVLASTLSPGSATLVVDDADQFVDGGGLLSLAAQDDVYVPANVTDGTPAYYDLASSSGVAYTAVDRDSGVVTLAVPWDAAFPTFVPGDSVWVDPPSLEHRIDAALDGDLGQTIVATVPHTLSAMLPEGTRPEAAGEWVRVAVVDTGYELIDVLNEAAYVDAASVVADDPTGDDAEFDVISASVVDSPSVPTRNERSMTLYVSPTDPTASDDNGGEALSPLVDSFARTGTTFGTADTGQAWGSLVNEGNIRDTDGADARIRLNGASQNNVQRVAFAPLDVEVLTTLNLAGTMTAGGAFYGVALRAVDSTRLVMACLQVDAAGAVKPEFHVKSGGTWTESFEPGVIVETVPWASMAAVDWKLRVQCQTNPDGGTDYRMRVWRSTNPEPDDWTIGDFNDNGGGGLQQAFGVGIACRTGASYAASTHPVARWRDYVATTLDGSGEPVDVTVGGVGPLATLAAAVEKVGEWNDGVVTLVLAGVIEEDLDVQGLGGGGQLVIDGGLATTLNGFIRFKNVAHYVIVRSLTVQDTGNAGPAASLDVIASGFVWFLDVVVQTNAYRSNVARFEYGSRGRVEGCGLHNAVSRGLYAANDSMVYATDNTGSGSPTSYQASCAIIFQAGSKPSNATNSTLGGQLFGSTSSNSGGSAPPPQPTKKTDTVTANSTKTWRPEWAWRSDDEVYQGEWQGSGGLSRGCAFYGTKLRRSGKTAVSGKVYVIRKGSGGMSGKQDVYLATHPHEGKPSGDNAPSIGLGATRVGALGYNEGAWFNIPKSWVQSLLTGGQRGLMLYHGSPSPYIICAGRGGNSNAMKVQITYQ